MNTFAVVQNLFSEIDSKTHMRENSDEKQRSFRVSVRYASVCCTLDICDNVVIVLWLLIYSLFMHLCTVLHSSAILHLWYCAELLLAAASIRQSGMSSAFCQHLW